jgi:hypothetical protein
MIIAQVRFPRSEPISLEDVTAIFESTAPKYKGRQGLQKKIYTRSPGSCIRSGHKSHDLTRMRRRSARSGRFGQLAVQRVWG